MASIRVRADTGLLFFDFRVGNRRFREQTKLRDTAANRKVMGKVCDRLEEQIALGTFNYREFFLGSKNAAKLDLAEAEPPITVISQAVSTVGQASKITPLFKDFAETWYAEKCVEWRTSHKKTVRDDIDKRLNPHFGEMMVANIIRLPAKNGKGVYNEDSLYHDDQQVTVSWHTRRSISDSSVVAW